MLAELAIANAAFKVIKATLENGKEISQAGAALGKYFGAEKEIQKQVNAGTGDVLAAFQAKEALVRQEEELKFMLNKQRLQGYADFVKFKVQYTRDLREAEKEKRVASAKRQKALEENVLLGIKVMLGLIFVFATTVGTILYLR